MPNDADLLNHLRDIHLPKALNPWIFAWGWWFLFGMLTLVLVAGAWVMAVRYRQGRAKRQAQKMLLAIEVQYAQTKDAQACSALVGTLLRRVALAYYPRIDVAGLQGMALIEFFNRTGRGLDFNTVKTQLLVSPYCVSDECVDLTPLFQLARRWMMMQRGAHV